MKKGNAGIAFPFFCIHGTFDRLKHRLTPLSPIFPQNPPQYELFMKSSVNSRTILWKYAI